MPRKVKIICTLGPSSYEEERIEALIRAGMNIARLNFSHGDHDFYRTLINRVRHVAARLEQPVAILQDLQGPKIRVGKIGNDSVQLDKGQDFIITRHEVIGSSEKISCSYDRIVDDVLVGDPILLDDGKIVLSLLEKDEDNLYCRVLEGGRLKSNKGINLPKSSTSMKSMTQKDIRDLHFGAHAGVDVVALSFVRSADDIKRLREELALTKSKPLIIAKLEKEQAIDNLEDILKVTDGVMVARGDLGVELAPENVPLLQKQIVESALSFGKTVAVATEMLESMILNARPTRAEASDVANAVLDGSDMLMLSAETAAGEYPIKAVEIMDRIVRHVEGSPRAQYWRTSKLVQSWAEKRSVQNTMAISAVQACERLRASAIVMFTNSGATAKLVSSYRPQRPIVAFVPDAWVQRSLSLCWGVRAHVLKAPERTSQLISLINGQLLSSGEYRVGDKIIVLTKIPLQSLEHTNTVHIHTLR